MSSFLVRTATRPGQTTRRRRVTRSGHTTHLSPRKNPLCFNTKVAAGMLLLFLVGTVRAAKMKMACPNSKSHDLDLESNTCRTCDVPLVNALDAFRMWRILERCPNNLSMSKEKRAEMLLCIKQTRESEGSDFSMKREKERQEKRRLQKQKDEERLAMQKQMELDCVNGFKTKFLKAYPQGKWGSPEFVEWMVHRSDREHTSEGKHQQIKDEVASLMENQDPEVSKVYKTVYGAILEREQKQEHIVWHHKNVEKSERNEGTFYDYVKQAIEDTKSYARDIHLCYVAMLAQGSVIMSKERRDAYLKVRDEYRDPAEQINKLAIACDEEENANKKPSWMTKDRGLSKRTTGSGAAAETTTNTQSESKPLWGPRKARKSRVEPSPQPESPKESKPLWGKRKSKRKTPPPSPTAAAGASEPDDWRNSAPLRAKKTRKVKAAPRKVYTDLELLKIKTVEELRTIATSLGVDAAYLSNPDLTTKRLRRKILKTQKANESRRRLLRLQTLTMSGGL